MTMTPLDDLLTALRAARPDPGCQPSATSPEARAMLARIVQARHPAPRLARRWRLLAAPGSPLAGRVVMRRSTAAFIAAAMAAGPAPVALAVVPWHTPGGPPAPVPPPSRPAPAPPAPPSP